jgi:hypothetical protein
MLKTNQISLKSDKNNGYLTRRRNYILWQYLAQYVLEWEMIYKKLLDEIKTQ